MEQIKNKVRDYIAKELHEIGKPNNPSKIQVYKFQDLSITIDLLFELLDINIIEPTLQRVKGNFYNHITKIVEFNEIELPSAIEGLATNFESFLKLIAFLKYGKTDLWFGDKLYSAGITKTSLLSLITGKIDNKYSSPHGIPCKEIPQPLIEYKGFQRNILDFVRTDLRNQIHNAKLYSRMELMHYSNLVLSCYLFAIESNTQFLKRTFLKEYQYLQEIFTDKNYKNLDKVYVELFAQFGYSEIDVVGSEIINEIDVLTDIKSFDDLSYKIKSVEDIDENVVEKRIDSIIKIASDTLRFEIIGQAGSGKSTTLHKILYSNAKSILYSDIKLKIPFLINANEYRPNNNFIDILSKSINKEWIINALELGKIQLLIDGLNEITDRYKQDALNEIEFIIKNYPENSIIISERILNFERRFDIPVFELQDLNSEQISSFILNYLGKNAEIVWTQLRENDYMLQLASNPLMLKMILSVSKSGCIPQNRGILLQLFINLIFKREKAKREQTNTETKIEILSYIAFEMRKAGEVSLPIPKFKNLISQCLSNLKCDIPVNSLYNEFTDNLIIKVSQNEDVSFLHETFQDYFCANQLKNQFEIHQELTIPQKGNIWAESLLICSELFKDKKRALSFFEYLFRGQKLLNKAKPLYGFSQEDLNENINIACKIAYSLKSIRPEVYKIAEQYLMNYLILWKYNYFENGISLIPLEELFSAVASLNSEKLINYIINDYGWARIWLYDETEDNDQLLSYEINENEGHILNHKILYSIVENTLSFSNFYNNINRSLPRYFFSKSISWRLNDLKNKLIKYQPISRLKKYFNENPDFFILIEILKIDFNSISDYDFNINDNGNNTRILNVLLDYHIHKDITQKILIKELSRLMYSDNIINKTLEKLFKFRYYSSLLTLMELFLECERTLFNNHIKKIQAIEFDKLPDKIKRVFLYYETIKIPIERIEERKLILRASYINQIKLYQEFVVNDSSIIRIKNFNYLRIRGNRTLVLFLKQGIENSKILREGEIKICLTSGSIILKYENYRITNKGDKIEFSLLVNDDIILDKSNFIKFDYKIIVGDIEDWTFFCFGYLEIEDREYIMVPFDVLTDKSNELPNVTTGYIVPDDQINISTIKNPSLYHPDLIRGNYRMLEHLMSNIKVKHYQEFISQLGLVHIFHKAIEDVNYGIIIDSYKNNIRVYIIKEKKFMDFNIPFEELEKFNVERIVVIENNNTIFPIPPEDEKLDKIGYIQSEIVYLDKERKEGFILKKDKKEPIDYYFHFDSCNYNPDHGDTVRFLPTLNHSKNHLNEPVALKITKENQSLCTILNTRLRKYPFCILGEAVDIETEESLFFSIPHHCLKYIKNLKNKIEENQVFEYSIIKQEAGRKKLVRLVKQVL